MIFHYIILSALAVALCVGAREVSAQSAETLQSQIQSLTKEIEQLQKSLNATTQQRQTLENTIKALDLNIQKLVASIRLTETQIKQKDREIGELGGSIQTTGEKISVAQEQIGGTLRELHALDRTSLAATLLAGATFSDFFNETAALSSLREGLQERISILSSYRSDLQVDKSAAEDARQELGALNAKLAGERKSLDIARAEEQKVLKETQNQESQYQKLIAAKQAEKAAFEAALFELASKLNSVDRGRLPPAGSGVLRWPLDNVFVTQQFGKTADAGRLYTSGTHDGVDFRASIGTPVRAALSGVVQEVNHGAVPYCQYGKWVLIKHSNGLTTLYAHLSEINVQKGQAVGTGAVVGYSGNTGYATGPHLHFTVYASEGVTFKQYTCKSGSTVTVPIAPVNGYLNPLSYL